MTNFNTDPPRPSRDARIDMAIPESFHRVKRTVMILSAVLFLLAFSKSSAGADATLNMPGFSLILPIWVARGAIWLAAAYYAWGLWMEADTASRINTSLFDGGVSSFQHALEDVTKRLKADTTTVAHSWSLANDAQQALEYIRAIEPEANWQHVRKMVNQRSAGIGMRINLSQQPLEVVKSILEDVVENLEKHGSSPAEILRPQLEKIDARLQREEELLQILDARVAASLDSLTKLSSKISRSRRISFWAWEIASSYALFALATIVTINAQWPWLWTRFVAFHSGIGA